MNLLYYYNAHDDSHATANGARPPLLVCQLQVFPTIVNGQNKVAGIHVFHQDSILRPFWEEQNSKSCGKLLGISISERRKSCHI